VGSSYVEDSFKVCGITNALDGSEDGFFNRKLCEAVDSYRAEEECREDAAYCILDDDAGSDDGSDFEGFTESDIDE
jgi:hypothetical protein